ncbi:hypothetical protein ACKWTF_000850 [Chironomus riparius]
MEKNNSANNNCRFCLRIFDDDNDERIVITSQISEEFRNITQTELKMQPLYSNTICIKCFDNVKNFCQFRKELINNQAILYQVFHDDETSKEEENFIDISQAVKIKLEVSENDSYHSNAMNFDSESHDQDQDQDTEQGGYNYQFKIEGHNPNYEGIYNSWGFADMQSMSSSGHPAKTVIKRKPRNPLADNPREKQKLCADCGKSFLASYLRRHYQRVHLKEKRFECDLCGLRTFKKQHIEEHLKRHFKIKDYHCDQCPSAFTTGTELKIHIKNVHCDDRPFKCDHKGCDSAFKQKENLKEHMLRHTQKKNFVCLVCDKAFYNNSSLKAHQIIHTGNPHIPCHACGKLFFSKQALKLHHLHHHQAPTLKCEQCDKMYFTQSELNHHMNSHSNIKKYQCQYCSNQYMAKNHLNRHISTVHMKAKIRCQVVGCTSDFPRKDRYRAHILSHHQNLGPDFVNQLLNGIKDVPVEFSNQNFQLA